ncbi:YHYH protein [bacterium]|nr:YHYH protein [bacterium]
MKSNLFPTIFGSVFALFVVLSGCESSSTAVDSNSNEEAPAVFSVFDATVDVFQDGNSIVIEASGVPNHTSPYWSSTSGLYEDYSGSNSAFELNPNRIATQNYTFRIPASPAEASNKSATPLGPIGVALNGVAIYNQYAGPNQPLTNEINSFDQYNGHPQQSGAYHYHVEPVYITDLVGRDGLLGYLLDGFPLYGPIEASQSVTNNNLDAYHGHEHATDEYPSGIYHYHVTGEDPYINGNGFFGTSGTVSQ